MKVGVFGAGWLGKSLALLLQDKGFEVKVTASSEEGREKLKQLGINAFSVRVDEKGVYGDPGFFNDLKVLIISLPPVAPEFFRQIRMQMEHFGIKKGILFSSTGIYADCKGEVDETTSLQLHLPKVRRLKEIEDVFLVQSGIKVIVLRLGGLWGADRHPVYFLVRKDAIEDADEPVNLVQRDTVCKIVVGILSEKIGADVFNVVDDDHRSKEVFYSAAAEERKLLLPPFVKSKNPLKRIVSGEKIGRALKK